MEKNVAEKRLEAANLRVLAAGQRANAAAHRRQADHPIYLGQDMICATKADQIDAFAARSEAQADLIDRQARAAERAEEGLKGDNGIYGHTPGKWIKNLNRIENENGEEIARVSYRRSGYVQANAHLIAAAPELLEALKGLLDMVTDNRLHGEEAYAAAAAIAAAEGRG